MFHCWQCGRFIGSDGFVDVFYDDYMGGFEEGYSECKRCLDAKVELKEVSSGMVDCLSDIKGFVDLNTLQQIKFVFKLKVFLDSIDKGDLDNHDLDSVKHKRGRFLLVYTRFDVCKEVLL